MLVLSRKRGQTICISDTISVTVLSIQGGTVKLGLCGPPEVSFHREEVHKRIQADIGQPRREQHELEMVAG